MKSRIRNLSYSEFLKCKNSVKVVVISVSPFAIFLTVLGTYWSSVSFCSANEQMDGWVNGWMDGRMCGWMDGQRDGWMKG